MDPKRSLRSLFIRAVADPERRDKARRATEARRQREGRPHEVLYFHQVDDPYSRLAAQVLDAFLQRFDVVLRFLPVGEPPDIAIHDEGLWHDWSERDAAAIAPWYGLTYQPATAPPKATSRALAQATLCRQRPLAEQAALAVRAGEALAAGDHAALEAMTREHGAATPEATAETLQSHAEQRRRLGHYLGGMFHYAGEWYWGIDRLHYLEARLDALGARRADAPEGPCAALGWRPPSQAEVPTQPTAGTAPVRVEFFPSLRSPYSHLSYERVAALRARYPVTLVERPVLPMMMRGVKADRRKGVYIIQDAKREAERLGIDFGNVWDPFGEPVLRAYSLFPWARDQGRGLEYLHAYSDAVWARRVNAAGKRGLQRIVEAAGLDWAQAEAQLDNRDWEAELERNVQDMLSHGCWGVPTFHLPASHGRPAFTAWGQDRIWLVEAEIAQRLGYALPDVQAGRLTGEP